MQTKDLIHSQNVNNDSDMENVIIEFKSNQMATMGAFQHQWDDLNSFLNIDSSFEPIPVKPLYPESGGFNIMDEPDNLLIKATVSKNQIEKMKDRQDVVQFWKDTIIAPFPCPIPPCDCSPSTPKGAIHDVANYLGVDQIWGMGYRGEGITVAVVDGGITALGRSPIGPGETTNRIRNVVDGWPTSNWGTTAKKWGEHGNMCATDVLGMAPDAAIYDIRISDATSTSGLISDALQGFQWCIRKFRSDGTPHIITNSWGIYQSAWDSVYARDPTHPFTRKVQEAINEGIIVLFAAGNCGEGCPDGRCGADVGPGRSIWGANGHPAVMTVGAVNTAGEFVGYSSQGPAALDPDKPDFCSVTHFTGYFHSDTGTSAATPIAAGVVALLKQAKPTSTHTAIKTAIKSTALPIGGGSNRHSGAGILQAMAAFNALP